MIVIINRTDIKENENLSESHSILNKKDNFES